MLYAGSFSTHVSLPVHVLILTVQTCSVKQKAYCLCALAGTRASNLMFGTEALFKQYLSFIRICSEALQLDCRSFVGLIKVALLMCRAAHLAGSDDEEHFQNKDRTRLARDKLRLNPVVLGRAILPFPALRYSATLALHDLKITDISDWSLLLLTAISTDCIAPALYHPPPAASICCPCLRPTPPPAPSPSSPPPPNPCPSLPIK